MNKYYTPPRQNTLLNLGLNVGNLALRYKGMKQAGELAKGQQDVARQRLDLLRNRTGQELDSPGKKGTISRGLDIDQQRANTSSRYADLQAEKQRTETPFHKKDFNMEVINPVADIIRKQGLGNAFKPVFDYFEMIAPNDNFDNQATYTSLHTNFDDFAKPVIENLNKEIEKNEFKNPRIAANAKKYRALLQAGRDKAMPFIMANTFKSMSDEQAARQAKLKQPEARSMKSWITPGGKIVNLPNNQAPPEGSYPYSSGMDIEVSESGTRIRTGVPGAGPGMARKTQGNIEDNILRVQDSIERMKFIKDGFQKKYLNIGKRFDYALEGWKQKLEGTKIGDIIGKADPKKLQEAREYWTFRQDSVGNLNKEIKWLTGAAMNKTEVPRLSQEIPNAGLSLFDGDAPDQFEVKLNNKIKQANIFLARYVMYLNQGITPQKIKEMGANNLLMSESQVRAKIEETGNALKEQGLSDTEVDSQLKKMFFEVQR